MPSRAWKGRLRDAALAAGAAALALGAGAARSPGEPGPPDDPLLPFARLLGGSGSDTSPLVALGPDGKVWVAASSASPDFPGVPAAPPGSGGEAVVLVRLDAGTGEVVSGLRLEGSSTVVALLFDASGHAFLAGTTASPSFPATAGAAAPPAEASQRNAFVARVRPGGTAFAWTALVGGSGDDIAGALSLTEAGEPVLVGRTTSADFPLAAPVQALPGGGYDAFAVRLRADGSGPAFATLLGGEGRDSADAVVALPGGRLLVAGLTASPGTAAGPRLFGGAPDAGAGEGFLVEVDGGGAGVVRAARLGASLPLGLVAEPGGSVVLWGRSHDPLFPAPPALHGPPDGNGDLFLLRLDAASWSVGATALWGGAGFERLLAVSRAPDGTLWATGDATADDLPVPGAARPLPGALLDAFVAAFAPADLSLAYATYLGGAGGDLAGGIAADAAGGAWFAGVTDGADFPGVPPDGGAGGGGFDLAMARLLRGDAGLRPATPAGLAAEARADGSVRLTWTPSSADATGFAVYRREETDALAAFRSAAAPFRRVAVVPGDASGWTDATVTHHRVAAWSVQAIHAAGGSAAAAPVVAAMPPTLRPVVARGEARTRGRRGEVEVRVRALLDPARGGPGGAPDPRASGLAWEIGVLEPRRAILRLAVPPGDAGWKGGARRRRWSDGSLSLVHRPRQGVLDLRVRTHRALLEPGPSLPMVFTAGRDSGSADPEWVPGSDGSWRTE